MRGKLGLPDFKIGQALVSKQSNRSNVHFVRLLQLISCIEILTYLSGSSVISRFARDNNIFFALEMSKRRKFLIAVALVGVAVLTSLWFVRTSIHSYDHRIRQLSEIQTEAWPRPRVAIVFGASVYQDDLSRMLEDRVKTAIALYKAGQVDRILVSGDNRTPEYNEPKAMAEYLVSHAVDQRDIVIDYAGRSTYETCKRAKEIFAVHQAILVTQRTHISRALYLAHKLGLDSLGVIADQQNYGGETSYQQLREVGASLKAFFNVHISPPPVVLGEKLPIK
jgi:SanA protein